jgi:alkaline phosphatase
VRTQIISERHGCVCCEPGSARFNGVLDNTEVFYAMVDALGLDARKTVNRA